MALGEIVCYTSTAVLSLLKNWSTHNTVRKNQTLNATIRNTTTTFISNNLTQQNEFNLAQVAQRPSLNEEPLCYFGQCSLDSGKYVNALVNVLLLAGCGYSTSDAFNEKNTAYPYLTTFAFFVLTINHIHYASKLKSYRDSIEQKKKEILRWTHQAICIFFDQERSDDESHLPSNQLEEYQRESENLRNDLSKSFEQTDDESNYLLKLNTFYAGTLKLRKRVLSSKIEGLDRQLTQNAEQIEALKEELNQIIAQFALPQQAEEYLPALYTTLLLHNLASE